MLTFISMLKRLTTIVLLAALISSNCSIFMVYAGFNANQKYIADNLCVNRSRPWLHCDGKCYFMKKLQQAEENEKKQGAKTSLNRLEVSFFQEPFQLAFIAPTITETTKCLFFTYTYQYSSRYVDAIFIPPRQTV